MAKPKQDVWATIDGALARINDACALLKATNTTLASATVAQKRQALVTEKTRKAFADSQEAITAANEHLARARAILGGPQTIRPDIQAEIDEALSRARL